MTDWLLAPQILQANCLEKEEAFVKYGIPDRNLGGILDSKEMLQ